MLASPAVVRKPTKVRLSGARSSLAFFLGAILLVWEAHTGSALSGITLTPNEHVYWESVSKKKSKLCREVCACWSFKYCDWSCVMGLLTVPHPDIKGHWKDKLN